MRCQHCERACSAVVGNELEVPGLACQPCRAAGTDINGALFHIQTNLKGTTNLRSATPKVRVTTTTQQQQDAEERRVMGLRRVRPQERLVRPQ